MRRRVTGVKPMQPNKRLGPAGQVGGSPDDRTQELRTILAGLGLASSDAWIDPLLAYLALLERWNKTYNLTAIRAAESMLTQHLADCLAVVPSLRRAIAERGWAAPIPVLDVGSGGGLPGVVLALTGPDLDLCCVDTVGKKAAFIRQVAVDLRLPNLRSEHRRVEELQPRPWKVITSRAFSSLADLIRLTRPLLAPDGVWMAMKGRHPADEIEALPAGVEVFHVEQVTVPGLDANRCLVWMRLASPAA